ncbi:tRNA (adenine(37)-N6)-methyltransferase-like [Mytilus edulis]|uniref:tRNA (adenine(37)-N6)-methyltransferase-like n=1 Tax=Mytilus edulis TaxID=6550 RepID=UPI0039EFE642
MYSMKPIGYVSSVFTYKNGTPRQPALCPYARGTITIDKSIFTNPEHSLEDLEEFSHVWVIFVFHKNNNTFTKAKVKPPRLNGKRVGVFSTRSPYRPNPIGLTLAKLDSIEGSILHLSGIDLLDGTPVLDIKPYIPSYDIPQNVQDNPESCLNTERTSGQASGDKSKEDLRLKNCPLNQEQNNSDNYECHEKSIKQVDCKVTDNVCNQDDMCEQSTLNVGASEFEQSSLHVGEQSILHVGEQSSLHVGEQSILHVGEQSSLHVGEQSILHVGEQSILHVGEQSSLHVGEQSKLHVGEQSTLHDSASDFPLDFGLRSELRTNDDTQVNEMSGPVDSVINMCTKEDDKDTQTFNTDSTKTADWIEIPPIDKISVRFTNLAQEQLKLFSSSAASDFCLKYLKSGMEVSKAISDILCQDPRSVYRRKHCVDSLYYFVVDIVHVTAWFDKQVAEVVRIQPVSHAEHYKNS